MRISRLFLAALLAVGMSLSGISLYAQDETTNEGTTATFQHRFDRGMRGPRALGLQFVDENGNGINDRLEDDDGDGVINAHDPDSELYRGTTALGQGYGFIDENGNGINDRLEDDDGDGVINHLDPDSKNYLTHGS